MEIELEAQLKKALQPDKSGINITHLHQTRILAQQEYIRKTQRKREKFTVFLIAQIRFIGWRIWAVQGAFLLVLCAFLLAIMGEYLLYSQKRIALLLCCIGVAVSMTAIPFVYRSVRYRMQEVETASRNSSGRLLAARLLAVCLGNILTLACIFGVMVIKTSLRTGSIALYLIFPFLLASCGGLYFLGHLPVKRFVPACFGMGAVLIGSIFLLNQFYPAFFGQVFSVGWAAVCTALIFFGVRQVQYLMNHSSFGEIQSV